MPKQREINYPLYHILRTNQELEDNLLRLAAANGMTPPQYIRWAAFGEKRP